MGRARKGMRAFPQKCFRYKSHGTTGCPIDQFQTCEVRMEASRVSKLRKNLMEPRMDANELEKDDPRVPVYSCLIRSLKLSFRYAFASRLSDH